MIGAKSKNLNLSFISSSISFGSRLIKSHLLSTIMAPVLCLSINPATLSSCSIKSSLASSVRIAISALSSAFSLLSSAHFSIPTILLLFLIPAVSTNVMLRPPNSIVSSTGSIVVPAMGLTIERLIPVRAFKRELLPTFTRPMMATLISAVSSTSSLSSSSSSKKSSKLSSSSALRLNTCGASSKYPSIQSSIFEILRLCDTETKKLSFAPNSKNCHPASLSLSLSILFTTSARGLFNF